jgi:hypothetical protein
MCAPFSRADAVAVVTSAFGVGDADTDTDRPTVGSSVAPAVNEPDSHTDRHDTIRFSHCAGQSAG